MADESVLRCKNNSWLPKGKGRRGEKGKRDPKKGGNECTHNSP